MKTPDAAPTTAYLSFIASMNITAEQWRDGIGFDLAASAKSHMDWNGGTDP